jgi:hypothetical protein
MKILAIEKEIPGVPGTDYQPHLQAEARKAWNHLRQRIQEKLQQVRFERRIAEIARFSRR